MATKTEEISPLREDIRKIINKVFPTSMAFRFIENLDDVNECYDISPRPLETIRIKYFHGEQNYSLTIIRYSILPYDEKLVVKTIYKGDIPADKNLEPDFEFIEKILTNYLKF